MSPPSEPSATSWFGPEDASALRDFQAVYDELHDATVAALRRSAEADPTLGPLVSGSPTAWDAQNRATRELLRRAIGGDWGPYIESLRARGESYARLGVGVEAWHELVLVLKRTLVPPLVQRHHDDPARLVAALRVTGVVFDRTQTVITMAYLASKERRIAEQRELAEARARHLEASEAELRRQSSILASVLESMQDGVAVCDLDGALIVFNRAAEALMHVRPAVVGELDAEGGGHATLDPTTHEPLARDALPIVRAMRGERFADVPVEVHSFGPDVRRQLSLSGGPLLDTDGVVRGGVVAFRDVTERNRLEEAARRSFALEAENRRVEEASRLKSEFLANMSHELRTPLNAILGFAELLYDGEVDPASPQHKDFLGDILHSGRHLLRLINDVLDLSKVEAGRMEFRPEPLVLDALVGDVVATLRNEAQRRRIRVEVATDASVGEIYLDPSRLRQVLFNFLSNALKFTPEGGRVAVRTHAGRDGATFRLEVEDTGIGIAPADLARLFVEFQQLDAGSAKAHAGTGLGLALTRRLVEAQGGSVGVESVEGRGSVFYAVLPRRSCTTTAYPARRAFAGASAGATRVLVVEDDARDQDVLVRALTEAGFAVETAATGAQALARCREQVFDAITLDLQLPDMSGLDVLRGLRADSANPAAVVVVVSVVAERRAVGGFHVHDLLPKPVDGAALRASLRRAGIAPGPIDGAAPVLVVDDDPSSLRLMEALLGQLGYASTCVVDGETALRVAAARPPCAVVLDLILPDMDGFEFLDRFRRRREHQRTPVLVWTSKDLTVAEHARLRASSEGVVLKAHSGCTTLLDEIRSFLPPRPAGEAS